jgi:hypothetical protein
MDENKEPPIGTIAKATRFGCGALLGLFVGLYFIAKWTVTSFGTAFAIWAAAILACGYLALKYGDRFWYALFGGSRY